jgi:C1A family cysteine protease
MRKFGWLKDHRDVRDDSFIMGLPRKLDIPERMRLYMSRIEDQGSSNACVGHGYSYAMEDWSRRMGNDFVELSRRGMYTLARMMSGLEDVDGGAYIRDGAKALMKYGIMSEILCEWDVSRINEPLSAEALEDAATRKIKSHHSCPTVDHIIYSIANEIPVVLGVECYESFQSNEVMRTGIVPHPKVWEKFIGGHCMEAGGYDLGRKLVGCPNSWGPDCGDCGWVWIPFSMFEDGLAGDARAIVF